VKCEICSAKNYYTKKSNEKVKASLKKTYPK